MSVNILRNTIQFLNRVQLSGAEAEALVECKQFLATAIQQAMKPKPEGEAPEQPKLPT